MPTTCWGVQRHHRALPASAPRSAQVWGAPLSAHESWEKPEPSRGISVWCGFGAWRKPVIDPAQVMFAVHYCRGCGLFFKPADSSTTGTVWCHRMTEAVALPSLNGWQGPLEVDAPAQGEVAFTVKAQTPPRRRKVIKWPLTGFTPALNFKDTGVCLQLMWAQVCSLCDCAPWQQTC